MQCSALWAGGALWDDAVQWTTGVMQCTWRGGGDSSGGFIALNPAGCVGYCQSGLGPLISGALGMIVCHVAMPCCDSLGGQGPGAVWEAGIWARWAAKLCPLCQVPPFLW